MEKHHWAPTESCVETPGSSKMVVVAIFDPKTMPKWVKKGCFGLKGVTNSIETGNKGYAAVGLGMCAWLQVHLTPNSTHGGSC
jgi:hypothetical protein